MTIKNGSVMSSHGLDYLETYMAEGGLDLNRLLRDDFLDAIKILWNAKKYVSALKLLFCMVDSLAYIDSGNDRDSFTKWLDRYCDLDKLGATSQELWELRNSLVHMTNLESRKVSSGKAKRLFPYVAPVNDGLPFDDETGKSFHSALFLLDVLPNGIVSWIRSYNENPDKWSTFFERYDYVVSDVRVMEVV